MLMCSVYANAMMNWSNESIASLLEAVSENFSKYFEIATCIDS